jgi:hypothetical protein
MLLVYKKSDELPPNSPKRHYLREIDEENSLTTSLASILCTEEPIVFSPNKVFLAASLMQDKDLEVFEDGCIQAEVLWT